MSTRFVQPATHYKVTVVLNYLIIFALLFSLPPSYINSRNSDPGPHGRLFPSSSLRFVPFIFNARRLQPFLSSSIRVESIRPGML